MGAAGSMGVGGDAGYHVRQVGQGQGQVSYHTGAVDAHGEEPGRWMGTGAAAMGLVGEVSERDMIDLYGRGLDPRDERWNDPATRDQAARFGSAPRSFRTAEEVLAEKLTAEPGALPERVEELRVEAERTARHSVSMIDYTFSPSKDITVARTAFAWAQNESQRAGDAESAALWSEKRTLLEDGERRGNAAALAYLQQHAGYVRMGAGSGGVARWVDAHDLVVASFYQKTSRAGDPQDHFHNVILPKAVSPDGKVRALDTTLIRDTMKAATAYGQRVMSEWHAEKLGLRLEMRTDRHGREFVGVDQAAKDLFSSSARRISPKVEQWSKDYREKFGREPNALEVDRARRAIHLSMRASKSSLPKESREQELIRWDAQLRGEVAGGMRRIAETLGTGAVVIPAAESWSPSGVIAEAVAACQEKQSTWTRSDLIVEIDRALPNHLGITDPEQIRALLESHADAALSHPELVTRITGTTVVDTVPAEVRLANGRSGYDRPESVRYASSAHVASEYALRAGAVERGRLAVELPRVDGWLSRVEPDMGKFGIDQAAAIRGITTSGAAVSTLVGPAGAGKSFTLGGLSAAWAELTGGRVIGLAETERASEVLRDSGVTAKNVTQFLDVQDRLDSGQATRDDWAWEVRSTDIIVVDEASMNSTANMTRILSAVDRSGARMLLTGDPAQLGAVGAGGAMAMVADTHGADVHVLTEVHRFGNAWEADASLALRAGDPAALRTYEEHGRLRDCGTPEQAIRSAATARVAAALEGRDAITLTATNERAATVNAMVRADLAALGRVGPAVLTLRDGTEAGTGDRVQARQNNYALHVTNRRSYTVEQVRPDGSVVLVATDGSGTRTVPAGYVVEHLTLGYAGTVHAAQGATVEVAGAVTHGMDRQALYVALSRGATENVAFVATTVNSEAQGSPRAVLSRTLEQDRAAEQAAWTQRIEDARQAHSMKAVGALTEDAVRIAVRARTEQHLDRLASDGKLSDSDRQALAADQGVEQLSRLLRVVEQAGHDPEAALRTAVEGRALHDARSPAQVLHFRISSTHRAELAPSPQRSDAQPAGIAPDWSAHLEALSVASTQRTQELGAEVAADAPAWALEAFGPVPDDEAERAAWQEKAATVAAYREESGFASETEPIGLAPGLSTTERRADWHAAWNELGRPERAGEESQLTEGALRVRVHAWDREKASAPPYRHAELSKTAEEIAKARDDAAIAAAKAEATTDAAQRQQLHEQAQQQADRVVLLQQREADLQRVAEVRTEWLESSAATRDLAERAAIELSNRDRTIGEETDRTTAEQWFAAENQARAEDDAHREIRPEDVRDQADEREQDAQDQGRGPEDRASEQADAADQPTEREADASGHNQAEQDAPTLAPDEPRVEPTMPAGVPSATETAAAVAAAEQAAERLADRRSEDEAHRAAEQAERAAAWRDGDRADAAAAEQADTADAAM